MVKHDSDVQLENKQENDAVEASGVEERQCAEGGRGDLNLGANTRTERERSCNLLGLLSLLSVTLRFRLVDSIREWPELNRQQNE